MSEQQPPTDSSIPVGDTSDPSTLGDTDAQVVLDRCSTLLAAWVDAVGGRLKVVQPKVSGFARPDRADGAAAVAAEALRELAAEALIDPADGAREAAAAGNAAAATYLAREAELPAIAEFRSALADVRNAAQDLEARAALDADGVARELSGALKALRNAHKAAKPEAAALREQASSAREEGQVLQDRRRKLDALRANGVEPFPYDFPGAEPIAQVRAAHEALAAGTDTEARHRVAGRIATRRGQGGMSFLDLYDRTGRIQLQATSDTLDEAQFARLRDQVDLGDLIGIDGRAFTSRTGELTLQIESLQVLAKALRPPPDKRHGLQDPEARYRYREVDLLGNAASRSTFIARSHIVSAIRRTLDGDGFLEVETPTLQPLYGGAAAEPFVTHHNALDRDLYLRIAPELYLKRCLVGGLERVYEIGKNFRNEGLSPKHNPEFTAIEWYEAYAEYQAAADRTEQVVRAAAAAAGYDCTADGALRFDQPWRRVTFVDAVKEATGVDLLEHRSDEALRDAVRARPEIAAKIADLESLNWPKLADELLGEFVEPTLIQPTFILDHPVELSPLAKRHRTIDGLTERWEAYAGGMEIANAFSELNDPDEQEERFKVQERYSADGDAEAQPYDEGFVRALQHGMPPAAGVGIGIDRLVMLLTGNDTIRDVVLFPALREL